MHAALEALIETCHAATREFVQPADIVLELAPELATLLAVAPSVLGAEHLRDDAESYARNPVYVCPNGALSLYCLVWQPGQWTPVHDHATWGVVGIVSGVLEERNFIRVDDRAREDSGIVLRRGGVALLGAGTVSAFVPNPDHIHRTGVARGRAPAVSLHLYGREMSNFHVYDLELGRRYPVGASPAPLSVAPGV